MRFAIVIITRKHWHLASDREGSDLSHGFASLIAQSNTELAGCDLSVQVKGAGAAFKKANDFVLNSSEPLRRRSEIDAMLVCDARFSPPSRISETPHAAQPA